MRDNDSQPIFVGKISSFEADADEHGCPTLARIIPNTTPDVVTLPYAINWTVRGITGDLHVGDEVICARFDDGTGIILAKRDGSHTSKFPGPIYVEKGNVEVTGGDVKADGISLKSHIHTCPDGSTSAAI